MKQKLEDFLRKNRRAGLNVGRAALFCIQGGLGSLKCVEESDVLDLCDVPFGTYR